jgi:allantoate deiminase
MTEFQSTAARILSECRLLANFSEEPGRTTRRFLTPPVAKVHEHLRERMSTLGMSVSTDAAGNLRGIWTPATGAAGRLAIGSHIDTVPDAGAFDGVLGVVLALELVALAKAKSIPFGIEVIAFSEEEGVRFGVPFLGSRAIAGTFDEVLLGLRDGDGIRLDEAIRSFGLNPDTIADAVLDSDVFGFFEIHIEQGPVLEAEGLQLAVVEGVAGQSRLAFEFVGQANHAGTTPMALRRDAMTAAAEWMISVESAACEVEGLVATVGKVEVEPNAGNVIAGTVRASLDVRHIEDSTRAHWIEEFIAYARNSAARRNVEVRSTEKMNVATVPMDADLSACLAQALVTSGLPAKTMPSGAGHDAMVMAARVPTAMLFLRTPGGISHHPAESVLEEDVEAALRVGIQFLQGLGAAQTNKLILNNLPS